ncbi:MAG: hypothetical protein ABMB14_24160, partial [Myxococcota bacterium]
AELQIGLTRLARGELTQARSELRKVIESDDGTLATIASGALLACVATAPDWSGWDGLLASWRKHARLGAIAHRDMAWPLEWAAKRASDAGDPARAREMYELAANQYALINDPESIDRMRRRIRALVVTGR